jgi:hypothetical protein
VGLVALRKGDDEFVGQSTWRMLNQLDSYDTSPNLWMAAFQSSKEPPSVASPAAAYATAAAPHAVHWQRHPLCLHY